MLRLAVARYRKWLVVIALLMGLYQLAALGIYDVGWSSIRTKGVDGGMATIGIGLVVIAPLVICFDLGRRPREMSRYARPRAAWYLGAALGAALGFLLGLFGLLQAGLRHVLLKEPETITGLYLGMLLLGQIAALWFGGFIGWVGFLAGSFIRGYGGVERKPGAAKVDH